MIQPSTLATSITGRRRAPSSEHGATTPRPAAASEGRSAARPTSGAPRTRTLAPDGEDGFTLVELLVVVLMLVALVGIAVPTFVGQQERAERAAVQSELRTAAIALESYRARNGAYHVDALEKPEHGFVRSLDVATSYAGAISPDSFCVRAWYEEVEPGERHDASADDADAKAEWAITENGVFYVGETHECP